MTWDAYNRRKRALRDVIAVADRARDGVLPWNDLETVPTTFEDADDLLLDLQMYWHRRLAGLVDEAFGTDQRDPRSAVVSAWREATAELPGVRAILDAHDQDPVLERARRKELAYLGNTAGLAPSGHPRAVEFGELVRAEARAIVIDRQTPPGARTSWLDRLVGSLVA
ncbi:MAG: hypothetical protein ACRDO8_01275 [Nocardioidaceae bacterium]